MTTPAASHKSLSTEQQRLELILGWVKRHRQLTTWGAIVIVVGSALFAWNALSRGERESAAGRGLASGRFALESRNYALAASELSRVAENYSGTRAAEEATILLAQVRIAQGQPQQAVEVLQRLVSDAGADYRAQAYGLLAAAYENLGRVREAAEAYQKASEAAQMDFLRASFLTDAGRVWALAGDTAKALAAYRRIVEKYDSTGSVMEARVRIGELTRGNSK